MLSAVCRNDPRGQLKEKRMLSLQIKLARDVKLQKASQPETGVVISRFCLAGSLLRFVPPSWELVGGGEWRGSLCMPAQGALM